MEEDIKELNNITSRISKAFEEEYTIPIWNNYSSISRFKSVRRAIRRGHVDLFSGMEYPNRPFNNRRPTIGRHHNQLKKRIYEQFKRV